MKRSTVILLVLVLAAAAVIFFWERKQPGTEERARRKQLLLPDLPEDDAVTRLTRSGADPLTLVRIGEDWRLEEPVRDEADRYAVEAFLEKLREAKTIRPVEPPVPWEDLGLDRPEITWTIQWEGGSTTIAPGIEAPLGAGVYVKVDDAAHLLGSGFRGTLLRPGADFRSKDLVPVGNDRVRSITVFKGRDPYLTAERMGDAWRIRHPYEDLADPSAIERFLDAWCLASITGFVDDAPEDLSAYGLDAPQAAVSFSLEGGDSLSVTLGKAASPPREGREVPSLYALISGRPSVITVDGETLESLDPPPVTYRSSQVFRHASYDVERLVVSGAAELSLVRDDVGAWNLAVPSQAPEGADPAAAAHALLSLRGSVSESEPPPDALEAPDWVLRASGEGFEEEARLLTPADGPYLARPDGRSVFLVLDGEAWRTARAAVTALLQPGSEVTETTGETKAP